MLGKPGPGPELGVLSIRIVCATILLSKCYQPLHRWLVFSNFYVCRIVSPKFQQGDIEINSVNDGCYRF